MKIKRTLRTLLILVVLSSTIGCDQISKSIAREKLEYYRPVNLINNYVTLIKVENAGAFLSVGQKLPQPVKILMLTVIPLLVLGFAAIYVLKKTHLTYTALVGASCMIGGGVGNIYDRITHGSVTDFLHVDVGFFQTGIFNMADVSIMMGTVIILVDSYIRLAKAEVREPENG